MEEPSITSHEGTALGSPGSLKSDEHPIGFCCLRQTGDQEGEVSKDWIVVGPLVAVGSVRTRVMTKVRRDQEKIKRFVLCGDSVDLGLLDAAANLCCCRGTRGLQARQQAKRDISPCSRVRRT